MKEERKKNNVKNEKLFSFSLGDMEMENMMKKNIIIFFLLYFLKNNEKNKRKR